MNVHINCMDIWDCLWLLFYWWLRPLFNVLVWAPWSVFPQFVQLCAFECLSGGQEVTALSWCNQLGWTPFLFTLFIPISPLSDFSCFSSYNELSWPTRKAMSMVTGRDTDMSLIYCISPKTFHCVLLAGSDSACWIHWFEHSAVS